MKICTIEHKTRKEVAAKVVLGLVDINNTKQADKKETTEIRICDSQLPSGRSLSNHMSQDTITR